MTEDTSLMWCNCREGLPPERLTDAEVHPDYCAVHGDGSGARPQLDTLRDELIGTLQQFSIYFGPGEMAAQTVDALLPTVRREIDQARADERERIAQTIETRAHGDLLSCPGWMAAEAAAGIARKGGDPDA